MSYSPSEIIKLMKERGIGLKKSLGQNFLINPHINIAIVRRLSLTDADVVVEIGTGLGNLTERLARKASKVIAFEIDRRFHDIHEDLNL